MALNIPPMPMSYPGHGGRADEMFFPCPMPGCNKKFKDAGDREMHVIDHYVKPNAGEDLKILRRKAIGRAAAPSLAPPPRPQPTRYGRKVA